MTEHHRVVIDLVSSSSSSEDESNTAPPSPQKRKDAPVPETPSLAGTFLETMAACFLVHDVSPTIQFAPNLTYNFIDFSLILRTGDLTPRTVYYRLYQTGREDESLVPDPVDVVLDLESRKTEVQAALDLHALGWGDTNVLGHMFLSSTKMEQTRRFLHRTVNIITALLTTLANATYASRPEADKRVGIVVLCKAGLERSLVLLNLVFLVLHVLERQVPNTNDLAVRTERVMRTGVSKQIKNVVIPTLIEQMPATLQRLLRMNTRTRYDAGHIY